MAIGSVSVVKSIVTSDASERSPACTLAASTVTAHDWPLPRSATGSSVNVRGPPLTVTGTSVPSQASVAKPSSTVTSSANVSVTSVPSGAAEAPSAGEEEGAATGAGPLQVFGGDAELRGAGACAANSLDVAFVPVQPPSARTSEVVLLGAGAAAVATVVDVPKPTR